MATPQPNEAKNTTRPGSRPVRPGFTHSLLLPEGTVQKAPHLSLGPGTRPVLFLSTTSRLSFKYPFPSELPFLFARVQSSSCVTELG